MPLQCNIDAKGRRARLIFGLIVLSVALLYTILSLIMGFASGTTWLLAGILAVGGVFNLLQAKLGWCAVRAMGIKTPQ
jgi:hypothetical protein